LPTPPPKNFIRSREFCSLLNISLRTFRRWQKAGRFPRPIRGAGWARWSREEIVRWLRCGQPDQRTWDQLNNRKREPNDDRTNETETNLTGEPGQPAP
jgi:predicted DNA-binding transcriptional regulator AlpA